MNLKIYDYIKEPDTDLYIKLEYDNVYDKDIIVKYCNKNGSPLPGGNLLSISKSGICLFSKIQVRGIDLTSSGCVRILGDCSQP